MNNINIWTAFVAGFISFISPCVLPLIPGYLSFISGVSANEIKIGLKRGTVLYRTVFFVIGFSLVFSIFGIVFSSGAILVPFGVRRIIRIVSGVILILFGLNSIFLFSGILMKEYKFQSIKKPVNALESVIAGMAFGAGWTPCIGPILTSILFMASETGDIKKAFLLLLVYSAGFAIPFLLVGLLFDKLLPVWTWFKKQGKIITIVSGVLLIIIGMLMITDKLVILNGFAM